MLIPWEKRADQIERPHRIQEFQRAYEDPTIPLRLIADEYGLANADSCHGVARRLGFNLRFIHPQNKKKAPPVVTPKSLQEEADVLRARLAEIEKKKADLEVRVEKQQGEHQGAMGRALDLNYVIFGLGPKPIATSFDMINNFLDGNGPAKLRLAVGKKELA